MERRSSNAATIFLRQGRNGGVFRSKAPLSGGEQGFDARVSSTPQSDDAGPSGRLGRRHVRYLAFRLHPPPPAQRHRPAADRRRGDVAARLRTLRLCRRSVWHDARRRADRLRRGVRLSCAARRDSLSPIRRRRPADRAGRGADRALAPVLSDPDRGRRRTVYAARRLQERRADPLSLRALPGSVGAGGASGRHGRHRRDGRAPRRPVVDVPRPWRGRTTGRCARCIWPGARP